MGEEDKFCVFCVALGRQDPLSHRRVPLSVSPLPLTSSYTSPAKISFSSSGSSTISLSLSLSLVLLEAKRARSPLSVGPPSTSAVLVTHAAPRHLWTSKPHAVYVSVTRAARVVHHVLEQA